MWAAHHVHGCSVTIEPFALLHDQTKGQSCEIGNTEPLNRCRSTPGKTLNECQAFATPDKVTEMVTNVDEELVKDQVQVQVLKHYLKWGYICRIVRFESHLSNAKPTCPMLSIRPPSHSFELLSRMSECPLNHETFEP